MVSKLRQLAKWSLTGSRKKPIALGFVLFAVASPLVVGMTTFGEPHRWFLGALIQLCSVAFLAALLVYYARATIKATKETRRRIGELEEQIRGHSQLLTERILQLRENLNRSSDEGGGQNK